MLPVRKGTPIPPLSAEDYDSCAIVLGELDLTMSAVRTPALRRELGDMRARIRAAMDGYEARAEQDLRAFGPAPAPDGVETQRAA